MFSVLCSVFLFSVFRYWIFLNKMYGMKGLNNCDYLNHLRRVETMATRRK